MKAGSARESSSGTMVLGMAYFALMAFCLWAAIGERADARNECPRQSTNCTSAAARS
jgi:hypothetical protein